MNVTFSPVNDRIIAKIVLPAPVTKSGIVLPDSLKDDSGNNVETMTAIVVACGPGHITDQGVRVPLGVKPGDRVIFDLAQCKVVRLDGEEWITTTEHGVAAVVSGLTPPDVDMLTGKMTAATSKTPSASMLAAS